MKDRSFNFKYLPEKSFLLSIFFHVVIFSTFILVLPLMPEPHRPKLVFLGSILSTSDVIVPLTPPLNKKESGQKILFLKEASQHTYNSRVDKPTPPTKNLPEDKRTLKQVEIEKKDPPTNNPDRTTPTKNAEINLTTDPYKPLRLKSND